MNASEYEEDLHAELGYRTTGRRELAQREWFSLRGEVGEAAPSPKAFKKLINVLRATKWIRENRERFNARSAKRMRDRPAEVKRAAMAEQNEKRRAAYRANPRVIVCKECGAAFCRVPWAQSRGVPAKFCGPRCRWRHRSSAHPSEPAGEPTT